MLNTLLLNSVDRLLFKIFEILNLSVSTVALCSTLDRIYSDYNFFFTNGSLSEFHELAVKQMGILKSCFAQHTVRSCVYNQSLNSVSIHVSR